MSIKPMLAVAAPLEAIQYPVFASPKLDGIRALKYDGQIVSRNLKPIPNQFIQQRLRFSAWEGLDGELIVGNPTATDVFSRTTSGVMSANGEPDFKYYVFDLYDLTDEYLQRLRVLKQFIPTDHITLVEQMWLEDESELLQYEQQQLALGYEGIMLRAPNSPYKFGRSTLNQGYLLKRKPLSQAEGKIVSYDYLQRNENEATYDALGYTKRSSSQEGKVTDLSQIGAITVEVINGSFKGEQVSIGTGFTQEMRYQLAEQGDKLLGQLVTFSYQAEGAKDKPRFPSFKGFRDTKDM